MTAEEQGGTMGRIVARAWTDAAFRERLLADAGAVLREEGVAVPEGLEVRAVANGPGLVHLVLPAPGIAPPLSEAELEGLSGGERACRNVKYGPGFYAM